jgi:hypothetical protein
MQKSRAVYGDNINAELKALAENIQVALAKTTLEKVRIGEWLNASRELLISDNAFGSWCKENFPGLNRHTRQNYMNLSKVFGGELFNTAESMPDTVLYLLARPSTPVRLQSHFLTLAKNGDAVKVKDVKSAQSKYSLMQENDPPLYSSSSELEFSEFDYSNLDNSRGGSQLERINACRDGKCVVAYPFDLELKTWASRNGVLVNTPIETNNMKSDEPFSGALLYESGKPSWRSVVGRPGETLTLDNYWRSEFAPELALSIYKKAYASAESVMLQFQNKLAGHVLWTSKIDEFWHAPFVAEMVNSIAERNFSEKFPSFWLNDVFDEDSASVQELSEQFIKQIEMRSNEEEIEKFILVHNAMAKALPFIKAILYTKF